MTKRLASDSTSAHKTLAIATSGLLFGLVGMLIGYGLTLLFPQIEVASYDWQVRAKSPTVVDPSIVVVTLDDHGPASCGSGHWNSLTIANTISALHHAGASVIAPAIHFEVPNPSECGDVLGHARLLEATKQAGNVVYPTFVQPMIANEARATGEFSLSTDTDGVFRKISSKQMLNDPNHLPFGLTIASTFNGDDSLQLHEQGLISFAGRWADQNFPTLTLSRFLELVQQRKEQKLSAHFENKIVLLFPVTQYAKKIGTPLEEAAPLGFLHANLLNTALTNSWFTKPSWGRWLFSTSVVIFFIVLLSSLRKDLWGWLAVGTITVGYVLVKLIGFATTGSVWPYSSSMIAIVSTLVGLICWPLYDNRNRTRNQIKEVSVQLTDIQENLARKELLVEQLEEELHEAKEHVQNTSEQFVSLSSLEDETRGRLLEAETEANDARQQLENLQDELRQLRNVSPVLHQHARSSHDSDQQKLQQEAETFGILTCSPILLKTFQEMKKAAEATNPVLILGETGTGKELFAMAAHRLSPRSQGPFVSVNMAAIRPELFESELFGHVKGAFTGAISRRGLLETADRGSVFLDEIGDLPLDLQAKLLRVLENGEFYRVGQSTPTHVDVRIIAATNRDLSQSVKDGLYREDLYYRLRSFVFMLPPLHERGEEDLNLLVQHILSVLPRNNQQDPVQLTQGAMKAIHAYAWPGNIRELRQILAQAVALADSNVLTEQDLRLPRDERAETGLTSIPQDLETTNVSSKEEMARREDAFVLSTLRQHGFDMQATAKALEWDRSTVTQRLKGLGFQALVDHRENIHDTAVTLAGQSSLEKIVELKLREYYRNLIASTASYSSAEEAIENSRKRLRNIPERHFPAIETLIRRHFESQDH